MSMDPAFVFPPPPPPPPKASAPQLSYQGSAQMYGQAYGQSSRGGFQGHNRGRGRGRGDVNRGTYGGHARSAWENSAAPAQNSLQGAGGVLAQPAYGHLPATPYPSGDLGNGGYAHHHQQTAGGPHGPMSYGYMSQPAVPAQAAFAPSYPALYQPQASQSASAFPLNSHNGQYNPSSAHAAPHPGQMYPSGQWQPSYAATQPQLMGPPIRMGFENTTASSTNRLPSNNFPTNYAHGAYSSPHGHSLGSANNRSSFNGYRGGHQNQSPNPYPPNNNASRDFAARNRADRGGPHQRGNQSFKKHRHDGPRPKAAPAVPSFLSQSLPQKPDATTVSPGDAGVEKKRKKRKRNALGLTPQTVEREASEDDIDEELALGVRDRTEGQQLKIEYKGQTSTLETPADIAAWIEERKKRFPTKQRIQEKEAEKERRWKEAQLKSRDVLREKKQGQKERKSAGGAKMETEQVLDAEKKAERAKRKRERIMKRLRQQQEKLEKLDAEIGGSAGAIPSDTAPTGSKRKREEGDEDDDDDDARATHEDVNVGNVNVKHDAMEGGVAEREMRLEVAPEAKVAPDHAQEGETKRAEDGNADNAQNSQMGDEPRPESDLTAKGELMSSDSTALANRDDQAVLGNEKPTDNLEPSVPKRLKDDGSAAVTSSFPASLSTSSLDSISDSNSDSGNDDDDDDDASSDDLSSSSSSENDQPDEASSTRPTAAPDKVPPSQQRPPAPDQPAPLCRQFVRSGHCIRQDKPGGCQYRHELPPRGSSNNNTLTTPSMKSNGQDTANGGGGGGAKSVKAKKERARVRKKNLYQRMLENDQEKECRLILQAIEYLGDKGVLNEG